MVEFLAAVLVSAVVAGLLLALTALVWWACVVIGLAVGFLGVWIGPSLFD